MYYYHSVHKLIRICSAHMDVQHPFAVLPYRLTALNSNSLYIVMFLCLVCSGNTSGTRLWAQGIKAELFAVITRLYVAGSSLSQIQILRLQHYFLTLVWFISHVYGKYHNCQFDKALKQTATNKKEEQYHKPTQNAICLVSVLELLYNFNVYLFTRFVTNQPLIAVLVTNKSQSLLITNKDW